MNWSYIQEVLLFPQMRPEKKAPRSSVAEWAEVGVPEPWVPVLNKCGYYLVQDIKDVNPQKLQMDACGVNKKYKLGYDNPKVDEFAKWIEAAQSK